MSTGPGSQPTNQLTNYSVYSVCGLWYLRLQIWSFFFFIFLSLCCTDDSDAVVGPIVPRITRLKQTVSTRGEGAMKSGFDGVEWNDGGIIRPKVSRWVQ